MAKNISDITSEMCCGCKACGDVCPKGAIQYHTDIEGFFYPFVNNDCINCGLCRKVCPELNPNKLGEIDDKQYIGCLDKNQKRRNTGSSGGVFGLLAEALLNEGYEICGAAFDNSLQLHHQFASNISEIERLKKSKYLQSDCSSIYASIKKKLKAGEKLMFVGTPCQCNALRNVAGQSENLILVDFACHGVPSQDLFDKCIKYYEQHHNCKVIEYTFRHKPKRYGAPQNYLLTVNKDGAISKVAGRYYQEPFYFGFQKYSTLRPSCYECQWAKTERVSDLTLADFWGVESATEKWDRTAHPSLMILNTNKGRACFKAIKPQVDWIEVTEEDAIRDNGSLVSPTKLKSERASFFADLQTLSFDDVVERYLTIKGKWTKDVYYAIPFPIRKLILKITKKI